MASVGVAVNPLATANCPAPHWPASLEARSYNRGAGFIVTRKRQWRIWLLWSAPDCNEGRLDYAAESDEQLAGLSARGDRAAAAMLIERHTDGVFGQCFRYLRNAAAAEDATQEVFLRVWKKAKSWKPERAQFKTWLARIAANYCLDQLRKAGREVSDEGIADFEDPTAGPADILAQKQFRGIIMRAVNGLPERQRMAIALCYLQEMSNAEAAEIMEVNIQAIESLLARGRRKLRDVLASKENETLKEAGNGPIRQYQ